MSPIVFPIQTGRSRLLLKIDSFDLGNTLDAADVLKMGASEVCDVSLERVSDYDGVDMSALGIISRMLFDFLHKNPDNIIYFYCDDIHDIDRSERNLSMSPQEYRSRLFSRLFEIETRHHDGRRFMDDVTEFVVDGEHRFIHLIYDEGNTGKAELLKNAIKAICDKP